MVRRTEFGFYELLLQLEEKSFIKSLFFEAGFGVDETPCDSCNMGIFVLVMKNKSQIGMTLICNNRLCRKEKSPLLNTIFSGSHVKKILILALCFLRNKPISTTVKDFNFDEKTVYKYYKIFRNVCANQINFDYKLGGPSKSVEIDETHLFKRKYNRGSTLASEDIWVFGIFERVSKKVYLEVVTRRDAQSLLNIVQERVLPGTLIYTDGWRGYSEIKRLYTTKSVNHRFYFVDPIDNQNHTNNIERLWRSLKDDIRGAYNQNYSLHLREFVFRRAYFSSDLFDDFRYFLRLLKVTN